MEIISCLHSEDGTIIMVQYANHDSKCSEHHYIVAIVAFMVLNFVVSATVTQS